MYELEFIYLSIYRAKVDTVKKERHESWDKDWELEELKFREEPETGVIAQVIIQPDLSY